MSELIVSVSGINDRTLAHVDEFRRDLDARRVPLSLFVAPRLKHHYRLEKDSETVAWLVRQREAGDAIVLHGFDEAATKRRRGEFATMEAHEANLRLIAADRILEQTGLRTRLFAPPRWKCSKGAVNMLPHNGFRLLIGMYGVTDLMSGTVAESRLVGIGAGFVAEPWWCKVLVQSTARAARLGKTVRLAVAAKQLSKTPSTWRCCTDVCRRSTAGKLARQHERVRPREPQSFQPGFPDIAHRHVDQLPTARLVTAHG